MLENPPVFHDSACSVGPDSAQMLAEVPPTDVMVITRPAVSVVAVTRCLTNVYVLGTARRERHLEWGVRVGQPR